MKTTLITLMMSAMVITTTACARDEAATAPKTEPTVVAKAESKSEPKAEAKQTADKPKTKRVCITTTDRSGKEIEKCRDVKIHKKLEGTEIPPKK